LIEPDPEKGEASYEWPEYLPDGRALLFSVMPPGDWSGEEQGGIENARIAVLDLRTGQHKVLIQGGTSPHYVASGHLAYAAAGSLRVVPFDLESLEVTGTPRTVITGLAMSATGAANFDVARDGTLVYVHGDFDNRLSTLVWVDRHGGESDIGAPPFRYRQPRLSPDGSRVAFGTPRDLGIWNFSSRTLLWLGVGPALLPVWTPDGRSLIFASGRTKATMYSQPIDGSHPAKTLAKSPNSQFPSTVSPDGTHLVFRENGASPNLMLLDLTGRGSTQPMFEKPVQGRPGAEFSSDGRLLVYQSNESGQHEVYARSFPIVAAQSLMVSKDGGSFPVFGRSGQEIFYVSPDDTLMSVAIKRQGSTFTASPPVALFKGAYLFQMVHPFDVSVDGSRFLMMKRSKSSGPTESTRNIEIVLNWGEELKRTVPSN
jgi:serine/threonine-protein kinase